MAETLPLMALHGSASCGAALLPLGRAFTERRFMAPDLPGYGRSAPLPPSALPNVAHDVEAVLGCAGPGRMHVFGHGYGGLVALAAALAAPGRFASLTLFEPDAFRLLGASGAADDRAEMARLEKTARGLGRALRHGRPADGMALLTDLRNGPGAWTATPPARRDALESMAARVEMDLAAALAAPLPADRLAALDVPVLVMMGLESEAFAQRTAELTALALPRVQLILLAGCGHNGPVTAPGDIAVRLERHLAMTERGGPMPMAPLRPAA